MMTKFILILALPLFLTSPIYSQFDDLFEKVEKKVEKKVEDKVDKTVDKTIDDAMDGNKETEKKKGEKPNEIDKNTPAKENSSSLFKFDFVPGNQDVFFDDFSNDAVSSFPEKWNTNGSGEVTTLSLFDGKWFELRNNSTYIPYLPAEDLTENFTVEFDIIINSDNGTDLGQFAIDLYKTNNLNKVHKPDSSPSDAGVFLTVHLRKNQDEIYSFTNQVMNDTQVQPGGINNQFNDGAFKIAAKNRISISVNKQRYRLYVNEKKVLDLPRLVPRNLILNAFAIRAFDWDKSESYKIFISNFRIAKN